MVDVSREYDFASDFPNKPLSPFYFLAVANAVAGVATVHLNYEGVNIDDPANIMWEEGKITYILVPTPSLPLLEPLQAIGINTEALNAVLKPLVDSAYDRTYGGRVTPPPSTVTAAAYSRSAPSAVAVAPAVNSRAAEPAPAEVDAAEDDTATPTPAADSADTARPTTRITDGNKFEPQRTGSKGATTVGGQRHSGSKSIGSMLGKIVKGIKKALTHE